MSIYDLLILGGGNAIALGIRAAKTGLKVAIVEKDLLGGTCPNRGCIPSKLLLGYADIATKVRHADRFYVDAELRSIDGDRLLAETQDATLNATDNKIASGLPDSVDLIRGHGRFISPTEIEVKGKKIRAKSIVVATGTRPRMPSVEGLDSTPYWTSDDVFELKTLPKSITIVGGGYIGCELAAFFSGVGVATTLIVRDTVLLSQVDEEVRTEFTTGFEADVDIRFSTEISAVSHANQSFAMTLKGNAEESSHNSEALLFAIGRVPNSDDIGLDVAGVSTDSKGFVIVDDYLRTNVEGVYCLGDLNGTHLFTHAAAFEATYLFGLLYEGQKQALDYGPMPFAVFTHPEIAGVGKTEAVLKQEGTEYLSRSVKYSSAAKGRAIKEQHGLCKFLISPSGEILGCHIVGEQASVLLHEVIPVMKWRNHISSLVDIIHIHPSLSEVVRNAARQALAALD